MSIRTIEPRTSLALIHAEITYTLIRLKTHPLGAPHIAAFEALRQTWTPVHAEELSLRESIAEAQARVDAADDELDDFVGRLDKTMRIVTHDDRNHPLYRFFFGKKTPSAFRRPVLGAQLEAMRPWTAALAGSDEPSLQTLGAELAPKIAAADAALKNRDAAIEARDHFRDLGPRKKLVDALNATRKGTFGALSRLPHEKPGLPPSFADRFFRRDTAPADAEPAASAPV